MMSKQSLSYSEKEWHPNGQLKSEIHVKNGKKYGFAKQWDAFGNLLSETTYKDGEKNGVERLYQLVKVENIDETDEEYIISSFLYYEATYKNNEKNGTEKWFILQTKPYKNILCLTCKYKNGKKDGEEKFYYENFYVTEHELYVHYGPYDLSNYYEDEDGDEDEDELEDYYIPEELQKRLHERLLIVKKEGKEGDFHKFYFKDNLINTIYCYDTDYLDNETYEYLTRRIIHFKNGLLHKDKVYELVQSGRHLFHDIDTSGFLKEMKIFEEGKLRKIIKWDFILRSQIIPVDDHVILDRLRGRYNSEIPDDDYYFDFIRDWKTNIFIVSPYPNYVGFYKDNNLKHSISIKFNEKEKLEEYILEGEFEKIFDARMLTNICNYKKYSYTKTQYKEKKIGADNTILKKEIFEVSEKFTTLINSKTISQKICTNSGQYYDWTEELNIKIEDLESKKNIKEPIHNPKKERDEDEFFTESSTKDGVLKKIKYYPDGDKESEKHYKNEKLIFEEIYDFTGNKDYENYYKNDKLITTIQFEGIHISGERHFSGDGKLRSDIKYKNGSRISEIEYHENGNKIKEINYDYISSSKNDNQKNIDVRRLKKIRKLVLDKK